LKINIDIDMTPDEARKLMGMPDMEPLQKAMMVKLEEKMHEALDEMSQPDYLFKRFFPVGIQGMEQFQRMTQEVMERATQKAGSSKKTES
jgi:Family of unknown function (DUF6489)